MMLVGFSDTTGPAGFVVTFKFILPESPFTLVAVIVDHPEEPVVSSRNVGLAERVKSGPVVTSTVAETFSESLPKDPLTVTV